MFPHATLMSAYGMTEAASSMTFLTLSHPSSQSPPRPTPSTGPNAVAPPPALSHTLSSQSPSPASSQQSQLSHQSQPSSKAQSRPPPPSTQPSAHAAMGDLYEGAMCAGWPAPGIAVRIVPLDDDSNPPASSTGMTATASSTCVRSNSSTGTVNSSCSGTSGREGVFVMGEVWTRGPHTLSHYWHDEQETCKVRYV